MAKKKETKKEMEATNDFIEVKTPVVEKQPKKEEKIPHPEDGWVIKDRMYYLKNNKSPLSYLIRGSNIHWFDEEKGYERELKYTSNQRTCFVDEMKGDQRLDHIIFQKGGLFVPKNKTVLQKLLSLYHPHRDKLFEEYKPVKIAETQLDWLEFEVAAMNAATNLDIDMAEAVMRVELGSKVSKMSSKEIRRDLLIFSKRNPILFLELASDDNVELRNFAIKANEAQIIKLSSDQRTFAWASNGKKLMTVPFEENPYSAFAVWLKTDEGVEVYKSIQKKLN